MNGLQNDANELANGDRPFIDVNYRLDHNIVDRERAFDKLGK